MNTIDMHCDTLMKAFAKHQQNLAAADIYETEGSVDLKRLKQGGAMAQFFAAFMLPQHDFEVGRVAPVTDEDYLAACAQILRQSLAAHSDLAAPAYTAADIRKNFAAGRVSAVFTIEDGRAVQGKMENIKRFYDMGVRAMSLTWNFANCFGYPNSRQAEEMGRGLTAFGREAVVYMQQLGMLVDVSHLSDGGFYDVAALCKKPFVATHSNARALSAHPRNLTDDMLRVLGNAGGVSGINFCPFFLNADEHCKKSTAERMAAHARHMADHGGLECVAIGTDFDGIGGELEIDSPLKMELLADALHRQGFSDDAIDKIAFGNVLRVMQEAVQ